MSLELVNTLATFWTFLVIAATALAAMVQLRHMRSSNQITVLSNLYDHQLSSTVRYSKFSKRTLPRRAPTRGELQ
jgi:hypothetical protein